MLAGAVALVAIGPSSFAFAAVPPEAARTATKTATRGPALNLYALLPPRELSRELIERHQASGTYPELLERVTRGLVGAPYVLSALGEGQGIDPDPPFRLDAFDCTTFVETALALASCDTASDAAVLLDVIRYRGSMPDFSSRRHLIEASWIPDLIAAGFVADATVKLGGEHVRWMKVSIDRTSWRQRRIAKNLALDPERVPYGEYELPYVPIEVLASGEVFLPAGTIINVVRAHVPWSPTMIAHQGIVLDHPRDGVRFVRHASPVSKRVIDEPLERMMQRYLKPKKEKKWKVVGIHLLSIVDPRAAQAPLAAGR